MGKLTFMLCRNMYKIELVFIYDLLKYGKESENFKPSLKKVKKIYSYKNSELSLLLHYKKTCI